MTFCISTKSTLSFLISYSFNIADDECVFLKKTYIDYKTNKD